MVSGRSNSAPQHTDPDVVKTICDGYEAGMSQKAIAGELGIARSVLTDWLRKGLNELEADGKLG